MNGVRVPEAAAAAASKHDGAGPLARRLVELLDLQPEDLVVGLGAESTHHCLAMLELVALRYQIVIVDSSKKPPGRLASVPAMRLVGMSALAFADFPAQWDKILLDDALVAEDGDGAGELLRLLFGRLRPSGRMIALLSAWTRRRSAALQRSMAFASRAQDSGFEVSFEAAQCVSDPFDLVVGETHAHTGAIGRSRRTWLTGV